MNVIQTMVIDHGQHLWNNLVMDEISVSKFKATCIAVLKRVKKTRRPVRVTRFGETLAEVVPPKPERAKKSGLGSMAGTARIAGDLIRPAIEEHDWEALQS